MLVKEERNKEGVKRVEKEKRGWEIVMTGKEVRYRKLYVRKKKVMEVRRESEVWEIVNRDRRSVRRVDERIRRKE